MSTDLETGSAAIFALGEPGGTSFAAAPRISQPVAAPSHSPGTDELIDPKRLARIIGANLRNFRKKLYPGWGGQKKFAEFLGLSANDLCVYEYGRILPNDLRQEEIAKRLGLTAEQLCSPLPGVKVPAMTPPRAAAETAWKEQVDELRRGMARLEGRMEALQEELRRERNKAERLQEANYALRHMLYADDTPEARARREKVLAGLAPTIVELVRQRDEF